MDKHKLIKDMREDCECEKCSYCPLELIVSANPRTFIQHKLVERFKKSREKSQLRDMGWEDAYVLWKDEGHAKRFADIYRTGMDYRYLKDRMEVKL